ncbi:MAG: hypothetical protein JWM23_577 [Microbacteriaceae bacterium]|nr:hypothetical protein [Microbacteriaceae bacterium]
MTIATRKPTGKPSWPITLIAGAEKTGKSYGAALAAGSDLISATYWVGIGEDSPDEYGLIADFDIVEHNGTYRGILAVLTEIAALPQPKDGTQILLVVDSMTRLWNLITDNAQATANARARAAAKKYNRSEPTGDSPISMDLWNVAKSQWNHVMDAIRAHQGPSIVTARLESVTVMDGDGKPTKEKQLKVQAEKSLPFDVGAVIEMPARGETYISGVRSVRLQLAERTRVPEFTMDMFWRKLGLHDTETGPRTHDAPTVEAGKVDESERDWAAEADAAATSAEASKIGAAAAVILGKDHETVARIREIVAEKRGEVAA